MKWVIAIAATLLVGVSAVKPALADEYLCDATQASTNELPVLKNDCPIGDGLWGKRGPSRSAELFWIQCGILDKPLALRKAKTVYQRISTDVWMMRYGKEYRCLIGPYDDYATALKEWRQIRKLPKYSDAFIREIRNQSSQTAATQSAKSTPAKVPSAVTSPAPAPA
ncbi:hypothetical protein TW74_07620, partial [Vibrio nigripulchritudo]